MDTPQEFQGHHQPSFADLHLLAQSSAFQPSDPIFDPRWQNIYLPTDTAQSNFDFMHFRQPPEDALSSASSSDSNGSYTYSIYSASSEPSNPLHYPIHSSASFQPQYQDQFSQPTSTLPPSTRHNPPDDANAWMYAQNQSPQGANGGYPPNPGPYHHHSSQRDSGEYDSSYSSGGEDQQVPQFSIPPTTSHHLHQHDQQQQQQQQQQQTYMFRAPNVNVNGGGGASPYTNGGPTKPSDYYASPPAGYNVSSPDTRLSNGGGQSYSSPYPSPSSQQQQGHARLTPQLDQLSIDSLSAYPSSPLSPPGSNNGSLGSPGPSRNRGYPISSSASSPYGRPSHHHQPRHPSHDVPYSQSSSGGPSTASIASSQLSQQQQQHQQQQQAPPQHTSIFSPSGKAGGGRIFAPNPNAAPPPQSAAKPKKEMIAGTPTHPDIPRPAVVAPPVPVRDLTKKSRGRHVPSVNAVGGGGATPSQSHSRERTGRTSTGSGKLETSPTSPAVRGGQGQGQGDYFPGAQWSDSEYEEGLAAHGQRSLVGQASPAGMSAGPHGHHGHGHGPGSNSSLSSPATSSSRWTADEAGPNHSGAPGGMLPSMRSAGVSAGGSRGVAPAPAPGPSAVGPAPSSIEAELRARPFVCTVEGCGKAYIRAEHLKRHVRSIHTNDKPYECPFEGCGREFSRYDNLCQHYKGVHGPTSGLRDQHSQ